MELAALDQKLEQLRDASSRVSANLLALDTEPTRELLDSVELEGLTSAQWSDASRLLAELFVSNRTMRSLVDDATALRASWSIVTSQRLARLRAMLFGCSIERSENSLSIVERQLLDGSRVVERCTPDELLAEMAADFEKVKAVVLAVAERWDGLPHRILGLRQRVERLDEPGLARRLEDLAQLVLVDPLAVDDELVAAIEVDLVGIETVADDGPGELASLRALVAGLGDSVALANEAVAVAGARFARHHLPEMLAVEPTLTSRVGDLERSAEAGAWRQLAGELAALRAIAGEVSRRADQVLARCDALFAERSELRGRLDALEAKAGARDRIEDPASSALATSTRLALYTAPTDLDVARSLVVQYGEAIRQVAR